MTSNHHDEPGDLRALRAEVEELRARLAVAEQVATLVGWCGHDSVTERGKALTQAWMDWNHAYGSPERDEVCIGRIRALAARRDEIRARNMDAIRARDSRPRLAHDRGGGDTDAAS